MPGQQGTQTRRLRGQVLVRLPQATADLVAARAEAVGLTTAAWVRGRLVDLVGATPTEAMPVRARRPARPAPTVDVIALARLQESVGEAVGTLRQVAGLDRARGGVRLAELDDAIDLLLAAVTELDAAKAAALRYPPEAP